MNGKGRTDRRRAALICALALVLASCTGTGSSEAAFHPTLEWGKCPADVEIQYLSRHRCGWLSVLQDRSEPEGRTIRLFVVETWPVGVQASTEDMSSGFGPNLGESLTYGDNAAGATRLGHIGYSLETRGTGHSDPSLACPEVDELGGAGAAPPSGGSSPADFLTAVMRCHDRLVAAGVDPADYDLENVVRDLEDLRVAIGVDRWWALSSYGTNSRYLFEYLREFPDRARAAYLDSPQFPQLDEVTGASEGTRYGLGEVFGACRADAGCAKAFPDLGGTWSDALARLDRDPFQGTVHASSGRVRVTVDEEMLVRAVRAALGGDGPYDLRRVPQMIAAAADGRLTQLLEATAGDPSLCGGYLPICPAEGFTLGVYLTALCRDEAPFMDSPAIASAAESGGAIEQTFADDPYVEACGVWRVPSADPVVHAPVQTDVPLLLVSGQFDSFSPPPVTNDAASMLDHAWAVIVPGQTHNALGFNDCPIAIRDDWIRDPTSPPDTTCLKGMPSVPFATEEG